HAAESRRRGTCRPALEAQHLHVGAAAVHDGRAALDVGGESDHARRDRARRLGNGLPHLRPRLESSGVLVKALAILSLACILGCERGPSSFPLASRPATPLDPATTGTIDGAVVFTGTPPPPRTIAMSSDPTCA